MYKELGFIRVGAIVPKLKIANPGYNESEIIKHIIDLDSKGVNILTTPELALTGYTCQVLFLQDKLL